MSLPQLDDQHQDQFVESGIADVDLYDRDPSSQAFYEKALSSAREYQNSAKILDQVLAATRLDTHVTNAHRFKLVHREEWVRSWEARHFAVRNRPGGGVAVRPLTAWSRSWYSPDGVKHWRAELARRSIVVEELAAQSTERPKLLSLTFRDVAESWVATGALRGFLNALRTHVRRMGYIVDYLWTAELQDRYALHFHVILLNCPYLAKEQLREWWSYGYLDIRTCDPGKAIAYATKYINKATDLDGMGGRVRNWLHSGMQRRRFGCTRAISRHLGLIPAWFAEWTALVGVALDECTWEVNRDTGLAQVYWSGELLKEFRYGELSWRILSDLLSSQTPSSGSG